MRSTDLILALLNGIVAVEKQIRAFKIDHAIYRADGAELRGRIELAEVDELGVPWDVARILGYSSPSDVSSTTRTAASRLIREMACNYLVDPHWRGTGDRITHVMLRPEGRKIAAMK